MTQFKVGDRVRLVKMGGSVSASWGHKIGATASVVNAEYQKSILIHMDNGPENHKELFVCDHEIEAAISLTPPATIQHEGYSYTRGEPVVPEWVKDGAWVVNIYNDELRRVKEVKPGVFDLVVNDLASIRYQDAIRYQYRPFTNEDWKWGMWAEYQGEKVFVNDRIDNGVTVSKPCNPYFFIPFSEITPTTAP